MRAHTKKKAIRFLQYSLMYLYPMYKASQFLVNREQNDNKNKKITR